MSNQTPGAHPGEPQRDRAGRRTVFRALGIVSMGIAVTLITIALVDFFGAANDPSFDAAPTKFWMFFAALPFFALGGFLLNLGFAGAHARYMAEEYSPAMRTVSRDLGLGGGRGHAGSGPYCRSCGTRNDADARFCDSCGTSMGA